MDIREEYFKDNALSPLHHNPEHIEEQKTSTGFKAIKNSSTAKANRNFNDS